MWVNKPTNLFACTAFLVCGLLVATGFLMTCFPAQASGIRARFTGFEVVVLVAFVLVAVVACNTVANFVRVAIQLAGQVLQIAVFGLLVWGSILLFQAYRSPAGPESSISPPTPRQREPKTKSPEQPDAWWQTNPYKEN